MSICTLNIHNTINLYLTQTQGRNGIQYTLHLIETSLSTRATNILLIYDVSINTRSSSETYFVVSRNDPSHNDTIKHKWFSLLYYHPHTHDDVISAFYDQHPNFELL